MPASVIIRDATAGDAIAVAAIYAPHVLSGTATFETVAPSAGEMRARIAACQTGSGAWLVAEAGGAVIGYAYCSQFRDRPAYRHTAEASIYVAANAHRRGIGRQLMAALIDAAIARGFRQLIAVIGDSANAASIGLHTTSGFRHAGLLSRVGRKFGRWLDVVYMQRGIGAGETPPE